MLGGESTAPGCFLPTRSNARSDGFPRGRRPAGEAKSCEAVSVGPLDRPANVRAVAQATQGDQHISFRSQIHQRLHEDFFERQVVSDRPVIRPTLSVSERTFRCLAESLRSSSEFSRRLLKSSAKCETVEAASPFPITKTKPPLSQASGDSRRLVRRRGGRPVSAPVAVPQPAGTGRARKASDSFSGHLDAGSAESCGTNADPSSLPSSPARR